MKEYLGDGVYAEIEHRMIKLSTMRNDTEHVIYLDPEVYEALVRFVEERN